MSVASAPWDGEQVRKWLHSRIQAATLDQAAADKRGYMAEDDYDKAAAEEWVCRKLGMTGAADEETAFAARIKALLGQDEYAITGVHDDRRTERHIRAHLRKIARLIKQDGGFRNTLRFQ